MLGCSCNGNLLLNVDSKFTYDVVFTGTVIAIDSVDLVTTFKVNDNYQDIMEEIKGVDSSLLHLLVRRVKIAKSLLHQGNLNADTITVFTPVKGASCGYTEFRIGEDYIIDGFPENMILKAFNIGRKYSHEIKNTVWTHRCTKTARIVTQNREIIEKIFEKRVKEILTVATARIYYEDIVSDKELLTVYFTPNNKTYNWIGRDSKEIDQKPSTVIMKVDVVFRKIVHGDDGLIFVLFNSEDVGGYKYSGKVLLSIDDDGNIIYKRIYYVSTVE
jgi:hypothetical protein